MALPVGDQAKQMQALPGLRVRFDDLPKQNGGFIQPAGLEMRYRLHLAVGVFGTRLRRRDRRAQGLIRRLPLLLALHIRSAFFIFWFIEKAANLREAYRRRDIQ